MVVFAHTTSQMPWKQLQWWWMSVADVRRHEQRAEQHGRQGFGTEARTHGSGCVHRVQLMLWAHRMCPLPEFSGGIS